MESDLISISEASKFCEFHGVKRSRFTFYRWIKEGKIEAFEVFGKVHISRRVLRDLLIPKRVEIRGK